MRRIPEISLSCLFSRMCVSACACGCVCACACVCSSLTLKRVSESVKLAIQRSDRDRLVKLLLQEIPLTKNCFSVSVKTMSTSETVSVRERERVRETVSVRERESK